MLPVRSVAEEESAPEARESFLLGAWKPRVERSYPHCTPSPSLGVLATESEDHLQVVE